MTGTNSKSEDVFFKDRHKLWSVEALADTLQIPISVDRREEFDCLFGERQIDFDLMEGCKLSFDAKIVESLVVGDKAAVVVRLTGQLYMLLIAIGMINSVEILLLNGSKLKRDKGELAPLLPYDSWSYVDILSAAQDGAMAIYHRKAISEGWTKVEDVKRRIDNFVLASGGKSKGS